MGILCLVLFSCKGPSVKTYTLVTYNVGAFSKEIKDSSPMIASLMKGLQPDFIALQELDSCNRRHPYYQLEDFSRNLSDSTKAPWPFLFSKAIPHAGGSYGIGALSRHGVERSFTVPLPRMDGSEDRALCVLEGRDAVFCSTHLDYLSADAALTQARIVTDTLKSLYGKSGKVVFLAGDLNSGPESEVLKYLSGDWTLLSPILPTFPSDFPSETIDYILSLKSPGYEVTSTQGGIPSRTDTWDPAIASDHVPIWVKVEVKKTNKGGKR